MIIVQRVLHSHQRYDTPGDWIFSAPYQVEFGRTAQNLTVYVSDMKNETFENLIAIHEIIEALLCNANGVSGQEVDDWDKSHKDSNDPGSIPGCPYYREHMVASTVERMLAAELQVDWNEYEEALEKL